MVKCGVVECLTCPLCENSEAQFFVEVQTQHYFQCDNCDLRFLDPRQVLSNEAEKERYFLHETSDGCEGYKSFTKPLMNAIEAMATPGSHGIDFGAGQTPTLTKFLEDLGYQMTKYDPYFWPNIDSLTQKYDFLVSCEVVEHFNKPKKDFKLIHNLIKPGGFAAIMTGLVEPTTNFKTWHYRRDPTHISFYSKKTFQWICEHFGFQRMTCIGNKTVLLIK